MTSALLTVCVLGSGLAAAAPVPATSPLATWAYGAVKTVDFSGSAANYTYSGSGTFGLSVIFNETGNSSTGVISVNVVRTIGAIVQAKFCLPDCSSVRVANFTYHAWETTDAWANLSTAGSVTEGGVSVPALALLNSSVTLHAKLRESGRYAAGSIVLRHRSFELNVSGAFAASLTPGLGLIPTSLTPGASWSSSSDYTATGSVGWSSYRTLGGALVLLPYNRTKTGSVDLNATGSISVAGSYLTGSQFSYKGASYPAVNLTITGPYRLGEGTFLVPASADVFGPAAHPWSALQNGSAVVSTEWVDVHAGKYFHGHFPIVASGISINSAASSPADLSDSAGTTPALAPAATPPGTSTFVQGQPESVAQANSGQNCLVNGVGCPTGRGPMLPIRLVFVAGVGTVAAVIVAMAVVARRRPPTPVYPNSALYPPGASSAAPARPAPAPKPADDDPLGHLW